MQLDIEDTVATIQNPQFKLLQLAEIQRFTYFMIDANYLFVNCFHNT
jgi:hypothetical protein